MPSILRISGRLLVVAAAVVAVTLPAYAQTLPNWNVTLPANPGSSSQKVSINHGILSVERTFPQNTLLVLVPLKQIATISQPYLYQKTWLIDLELSKHATMVNKLNLGMVDRSSVGEVSLLFLNRADAAQAREYLMARLRS